MKQNISIPVKDAPLTQLGGITFARVPYFFPFFDYKDLKMDLLLPFTRSSEQKRPLLIWVCGGAWMTMDRTAHLPWLTHFAKAGYVVASIEYRLSNSAHFPAQLEDVKKAIRYLRAHAGEFGIDPEKIAIGGESAGACLASMAGVTGDTTEFDKGDYLEYSSHVSAVIDYYGPSSFTMGKSDAASFDESEKPDFLKGPSPESMLLGYDPAAEPQRAAGASPMTYINDHTPPFFIAHGTNDVLVSIRQSEALCDTLECHQIPVSFYTIAEAGHADPRFYQTEMAERILSFLGSALR